MSALLSRDSFRNEVFARDRHTCVVPGCRQKADDAHHIIERRLWQAPQEKEGYFLDNGASLCEPHHQYGAETCVLQPMVLRAWAGIKTVKLPLGWDPTQSHDKWGVVLKQPSRSRIKYPSTPYLHLSPGYDVNDINLPNLKPFLNQPLVVTVKMDGSNVQVWRDPKGVAARNGSHADHVSFDALKAQHAQRWNLIPEQTQVMGEWLFARHSVAYEGSLALKSLFQPFGVYHQDFQVWAAWSDVEAMAKRLGVATVPVLEAGKSYAEEWQLQQRLTRLFDQVVAEGHEGIVVRSAHPFPYGSFEGYETTNGKTKWRVAAIGKMVRADHVQTSSHWTQEKLVKNQVA